MARKKVLIVTYYWYPFAGVGTYRISRFAKYLSKAGWEVVILTTKKAAAGMQEEPDDPELRALKVYRANIIEPVNLLKSGKKEAEKTSDPSIFYRKNNTWKSKLAVWFRLNVMVPDAKFTWKWFAVPLGKKVIIKENPDLILSTSPPPTTSLIARDLAKWSGLPWVADFRDPWTNIYYYDDNPQSTWARKKNKKLEASALNSADQLTLVNNGFFPEYNISEKSTVIPNGFDPDHIIESPDNGPNSKFTIRYFGSMKTNQYPDAFINALKNIKENHSEKAQRIAVEFFGNIDPQIRKDIESLSPEIESKFPGFIPHKQMMELVNSANLLLLTIGKTKNSKFALSTKVFEYMISGKPILGIGPVDGAASELVQKTNVGAFYDHKNEEGVTAFLLKIFDADQQGETLFTPNQKAVNEYNFQHLTARLEKVMQWFVG